MYILFIRHGQSENNLNNNDTLSDPHLTEIGKLQANFLKQPLLQATSHCSEFQVWTSGLIRTQETYDCSGLECKKNMFLKEINEWDKHETREKLIERVDNSLDDIRDLSQTTCELLIVFGHGRFFSMMCTRMFGRTNDSNNSGTKFVAEIPNCSISTLEFSKGSFKVHQLCDVSHMYKAIRTSCRLIY